MLSFFYALLGAVCESESKQDLYEWLDLLGYSALCTQSTVQPCFSYHPVSLCVAVMTLSNKLCVMRLVDFLIAAIIRMPVNCFDKRKKAWDLFDLKFSVF